MTKFETIGVGFQIEAETPAQAVRSFNYSCKVCCAKGIRLNCDHCAISVTHNQVLGMFRDVDEAMQRKHEREMHKAAGIPEVIAIRVAT